MKAEYRIVRDSFYGYQTQVRRWWWPFWIEAGFANSHRTIEDAEIFARRLAQPTVIYLGRLP